MSTSSPSKFMGKMHPISILEEDEEEEEDEEQEEANTVEEARFDPGRMDSILGIEAPRILSRHSSTSSLADKVAATLASSTRHSPLEGARNG